MIRNWTDLYLLYWYFRKAARTESQVDELGTRQGYLDRISKARRSLYAHRFKCSTRHVHSVSMRAQVYCKEIAFSHFPLHLNLKHLQTPTANYIDVESRMNTNVMPLFSGIDGQ